MSVKTATSALPFAVAAVTKHLGKGHYKNGLIIGGYVRKVILAVTAQKTKK